LPSVREGGVAAPLPASWPLPFAFTSVSLSIGCCSLRRP
jgi:hypothetical protein